MVTLTIVVKWNVHGSWTVLIFDIYKKTVLLSTHFDCIFFNLQKVVEVPVSHNIWILKQCQCASLTYKLWSPVLVRFFHYGGTPPPSVKLINRFSPPFKAPSPTKKKKNSSHLKRVRDIKPDETSTSQRVRHNFIHMTAIKCHVTAIKCNVMCKLSCSYMPKVSNVKAR